MTGTSKAALVVTAYGMTATTTVVCGTFVDIYDIASNLGFFCHFKTLLYYTPVWRGHG